MDKLTASLVPGATKYSVAVRYSPDFTEPDPFYVPVEASIFVMATGWRARAACAVAWEA